MLFYCALYGFNEEQCCCTYWLPNDKSLIPHRSLHKIVCNSHDVVFKKIYGIVLLSLLSDWVVALTLIVIKYLQCVKLVQPKGWKHGNDSLYNKPMSLPLDRATVLGSWMMVMLKTAFMAGSSKHGNAFLANVACICEAATILQKISAFSFNNPPPKKKKTWTNTQDSLHWWWLVCVCCQVSAYFFTPSSSYSLL